MDANIPLIHKIVYKWREHGKKLLFYPFKSAKSM